MASKPRNDATMPFPGESPTIFLAMAAGQQYGLQPEERKPARASAAGSKARKSATAKPKRAKASSARTAQPKRKSAAA